jgi:hypothetical protein
MDVLRVVVRAAEVRPSGVTLACDRGGSIPFLADRSAAFRKTHLYWPSFDNSFQHLWLLEQT